MKYSWKRLAVFAGLLIAVLFLLDARVNATASSTTPDKPTFIESKPVTPVLSPSVLELQNQATSPSLSREINPLKWMGDGIGLEGTSSGLDALAADSVNSGETPNPLFTFEAQGNFNQYTPPDTDGDVGPNHYIQMVNVSFTIYDKSGNLLAGPTPYNALFTGAGGNCQSDNSGDPVVLYDELADRWILTQFAVSTGQDMCFAVSKTPDPLGAYWLYEFGPLPDFPDYPKLGVWPDAYYMGTNSGFPNAYYAYAFDRVKMLAGQPATYQAFGGYPNFLMPADVDGSTPPPAGTPGKFYTMLDAGYPNHPAGVDRISFYDFDVDWTTPANTTFTLVQEYPITAYNYTVCGFFVQNCLPQPGTGQTIDTLSYWPMFRLAYRNLGSYEAMVGNFTVDLDNTNKAAIRWFEMRDEGSGWDLYQEGTYAPNSDHRWMGSIAMDGSGNIGLGYSVTSSTTIPSIRYATRLNSDPLGTLQAEATGWAGTGVQTGAVRWGDYSAMNVDPADDCTFWYTTEYHEVNDAGFSWNTRVIVFKLPECTGALGPDFTLSVTPTSQAICTPDDAVFNVNVGQVQGYTDQVTLSALGTPAGTTTSFSVNPVTPPGTSDLTIGNTGAAAAGSYSIDVVGVAATSTHTSTVTLDLYTAIPAAPTLTSPANGATDVALQPTYQWNSVSQAPSYFIEVATDAGFTNIVDSATVATNNYTPATPLADGTQYYWRVTASNVCGEGATSATFSFTTVNFAGVCNPAAITINDAGPGSPYPSNITVAGYGNALLDVNVQLFGLSHTYPDDIDLLLVGPQGQNLIILSDAGGSTDVVTADVVFDDAAAGGVPDAGPLVTGTYQPTNITTGDTFPAPAPAPSSATTLATFNGTDPNGTWSLYIVDDAGIDTGAIAGGWCLELAAIEPSAPSIEVGPSDLNATVASDTVVTQTLTISNTGDADLDWSIDEDNQGLAPVGGPTTRQGTPPPQTSSLTAPASVLGTIVGDGSFEGGTPNSFWTEASTNFGTPLCDAGCGTGGGTGPHTGSWWAWFGGIATYEEGSVSQDVLIPSGVATLTFWLELPTTCDSAADYLEVTIDGNQVFLIDGTSASCGVVGYALQTVDVSAYADDGTHTLAFHSEVFGTNATVTNFFVDDVAIDVSGAPAVCTAPADIPWASVTPTSGTTAAGGSDDVAVVFDTTGLSTGVYTGTLCITSNDATNPLVTVPLYLTVEETTYGVALSGDQAETAVVGETVTYTLAVTNTGNAADTFDLSVASTWPADLSDTSVALGPGASATIWVAVTVPAGTADGDVDVATVTATSQAEPTATDSAALTTTADVLPTYGVELSADQAATGEAGTTVSYEVTVTNLGDTADTFDLSLSGAWAATLSDTSVTLAAGASTTVTVEVTVPADAADGDSDVTTVTATSQTDPTATDSSDLTTTAGVPTFHIFLPIVSNDD